MRPSFNRSTALLFILPALFTLTGLGMLAPGLWIGYRSWAFLQEAQAAPGTVIGLHWSDDAETSGARPVVRYEVRGEPYEITGNVWSSPPAYAVGDVVRVLYPPGQPKAARLEAWFDLWFLPAFLGSMGLLFTLVGLGVGYLMWRTAGMLIPPPLLFIQRLSVSRAACESSFHSRLISYNDSYISITKGMS